MNKTLAASLIVAGLINFMLIGWVAKGKQFDDDVKDIKYRLYEIKEGQKAERLRLDWYMEGFEKIYRNTVPSNKKTTP